MNQPQKVEGAEQLQSIANMSFESVFSRSLLFLMMMDPFGNLPVFVVTLKRNSAQEYRHIIFRESVFALAAMLIALFAGGMFLKLLHLSEDKLGIAGGLILFIIGLKMVFSSFSENAVTEEKEPYIVPLACYELAILRIR